MVAEPVAGAPVKRRRPARWLARTLAPLILAAGGVAAQDRPNVGARAEYDAGGELETYLRVLQTLGRVPAYPWGVRRFTPREIDRLAPGDSGHPWAGRYDFHRGTVNGVGLVRPSAGAIWNSAFPLGDNMDGVWAGRGVTGMLSGGAWARWDRVSVTLAPMTFRTQNASFPLTRQNDPAATAYQDWRFARYIDLPQRFGDGPYGRLTGGQSSVDIAAAGVAIGASTANETWGPGVRYPFILGRNAEGFPHLSLGTTSPWNLGLFTLHGRMLWGTLQQSPYMFPPPDPGLQKIFRPTRFVNSIALTLQPRGIEGLEVGVIRFTHAPMPDHGLPWRYLVRAIGNPLKSTKKSPDGVPIDSAIFDGDNQIASGFARWVFPGSGLELYLEYGREDYPWDLRYILISPDEQAGRLFGIRKAFAHADGRITVVHAELLNYQQQNVDRSRGGSAIYVHNAGSNQGHTAHGLMLGAPLSPGSSAGAELGVDRYEHDGRWSLAWRREIRGDAAVTLPGGYANPTALWVRHALVAERLWFRGLTDVRAGATYAYDFNRNFTGDAAGLSLSLTLTRSFR